MNTLNAEDESIKRVMVALVGATEEYSLDQAVVLAMVSFVRGKLSTAQWSMPAMLMYIIDRTKLAGFNNEELAELFAAALLELAQSENPPHLSPAWTEDISVAAVWDVLSAMIVGINDRLKDRDRDETLKQAIYANSIFDLKDLQSLFSVALIRLATNEFDAPKAGRA